MKIGYVCSLKGQKDNTNSDIVIALKKAGCQTIFNDLLDFVGDEQSNLILALEYVRAGDILVIWCLFSRGEILVAKEFFAQNCRNAHLRLLGIKFLIICNDHSAIVLEITVPVKG